MAMAKRHGQSHPSVALITHHVQLNGDATITHTNQDVWQWLKDIVVHIIHHSMAFSLYHPSMALVTQHEHLQCSIHPIQ